MNKKEIVAFVKIGNKEHIEEFCHKGLIYMNPISFFKKIEDGKLRGDIHEGRHLVSQGDFIKLKINDDWLEFNKEKDQSFNCQFYQEYAKTKGNIFSMYTLFMPVNNENITVDKRNLEFGDYCLVITYTSEFMNRVKSSFEAMRIKLNYSFVNYYDYKTYSGKAGVFHKSNIYDYQNEFRLFYENENNTPFSLKIGSISDISKICKSQALLDIKVWRK